MMHMPSLPLHLLLLAFASYAAGAASLTPPPLSAPSDSSDSASISATPSSSLSGNGSASTTGTVNSSRSGNTSASATSSAQFPSLSGLSSCANNCLGLAIADDNCTSYVDVNCYCVNATRFASGLVACIATSCPGDLSAAEDVAEQFCARAAASTSLSFPTPPPSTTFSNPFASSSSSASANTSASASSTSTSPSASSTGARSSGNGAGSWRHGHGHGYGSREAAVAGAVGLAGALLGVLFA